MQSRVQDEVLRQRHRLAADLPSREAAVALTCLVFFFYLPFWQVAAVWAICIATEFSDWVAYRRYARTRHPAWYGAILFNSGLALGAFSTLGVLAWSVGDALVRLAGVLSIVGALINVSSARSIHLPLGLSSGLPPSLALAAIATGTASAPAWSETTLVALAAVAGLVGYFLSALVQNNRSQSGLALESARARAAGEAKSRFLSEMSHEMRTPLNAILGLAQTLPDAPSANEIRDCAIRIEAAARELGELVDGVLNLAAATEGNLAVHPIPVVVRREIGTLARLLSDPDAAAGGPPPEVVVAPDVPETARFDARLVRRSLRLLARTAAGSGRSAAVRRIACRRHGDRALSVSLTLRPATGPADRSRPSESAERLTTELLDRLASLIGGSIEWQDDGSLGTTVRLTFACEPLFAAASQSDSGFDRALRALVVDDIPTNRFVVVQLLRSLRVDAVEADSGEAALRELDVGHYDLVLLDMNMPGMDGEATFQAIRSAPGARASVPVIAMTAGAIPDTVNRLRTIGLDGFVAKPVDRTLLRAEIETVLPPAADEGSPRPA